MNSLRALFVTALLIVFSLTNALIADEVKKERPLTVQEKANSTSIIWLADQSLENASLLAGALRSLNLSADEPVRIGNKIGFLVNESASGTKQFIGQLMQSENKLLAPEIKTQIFGAVPNSSLVEVGENSVGFSFADCVDPKLRYATMEQPLSILWGIERVWKTTPTTYNKGGVAWIIDSGIGSDFNGELNIQSRKNCTRSGCLTDGLRDRVGHGTMIAGIIGAIGGNSKGVVGVAPGVPIHALRVVEDSSGQFNIMSLVYALAWLEGNASDAPDGNLDTPSPGDVINISLGTPWLPGDPTLQAVADSLKNLADLGLRISIAAGNSHVLNDLGYVQSIFPARLGAYRSAAKGVIATASAIEISDRFWQMSAFGNFTAEGKASAKRLPDFAEPGVDIVSLWPNADLAKCSGTSMSAAFLSGILLWGDPKPDGKAKYDRSAEVVGLTHKPAPGTDTDYVEELYDTIAIKP